MTSSTSPSLAPTTTSPEVTTTLDSSSSRVKKQRLFYMLLMGFRAESESEAISMFRLLKDTAKNASGGSVAVVETV